MAPVSTTSARVGPSGQRKIRAKRVIGTKKLSASRMGPWSDGVRPALRHMDGDIQLLEFRTLIVGEVGLGHELVVPAHGGFERQLFDGGDEVQRRRGLLEAEHFFARQGAHSDDLRALAPTLEKDRRVGGGLLLKLVEQL